MANLRMGMRPRKTKKLVSKAIFRKLPKAAKRAIVKAAKRGRRR